MLNLTQLQLQPCPYLHVFSVIGRSHWRRRTLLSSAMNWKALHLLTTSSNNCMLTSVSFLLQVTQESSFMYHRNALKTNLQDHLCKNKSAGDALDIWFRLARYPAAFDIRFWFHQCPPMSPVLSKESFILVPQEKLRWIRNYLKVHQACQSLMWSPMCLNKQRRTEGLKNFLI